MPEVISYQGVDPKILNQRYVVASVQKDSGRFSTAAVTDGVSLNMDTVLYSGSLQYDPDSVVDMPFNGFSAANSNSQGWLRDRDYFNRAFYQQCPQAFSPENIQRMNAGKSLQIDDTMSGALPQYQGFEGQRLVHHHIGGDGQAVGIPESLHIGYGGVHNAEEAAGVRANAEAYSAYYADAVSRNPNMSPEAIQQGFQNSQTLMLPAAAPQTDPAVAAQFPNGGSCLMSKKNYDNFVANNPDAYLGRFSHAWNDYPGTNAIFMAPKEEIDQLLQEHPNDPRAWEEKLGLNPNSLGDGEVMRVDVPNAANYSLNEPTSKTAGANGQYVPGGQTSGDITEAVAYNLPTPANDPAQTQASCVYDPAQAQGTEQAEDSEKSEDGKAPENDEKPDDGRTPEDGENSENAEKPEEGQKPDDGQNPEDEQNPKDEEKPQDEQKTEDEQKPQDEQKTEDEQKPQDEQKTEDGQNPEWTIVNKVDK